MTSTFCTGTITRHTNMPTVGSSCSVERLGATRDDSGRQCDTFCKGTFSPKERNAHSANIDNNKVAGGFFTPSSQQEPTGTFQKMGEISSNSNPRGRLGIHAVAWELWFPWNRGAPPSNLCELRERHTHKEDTDHLGTRRAGTREEPPKPQR